MSITAYTPTKTYADGNRWTKAVMDDFVDALDTWLNSEVETKCPDKTGTETISGAWTFSVQPTFSSGIKSGNNTIVRSDGDIWTLPDLGNVNFVSDSGAQTLSSKTFTGTDALLIPASTPTVNRSIAIVNDVLQVFDSSAVRSYAPIERESVGLRNIGFAQGSDTSQLKITAANGSALGSTNPGYVRIPSSTAGTFRTFTVTADVTIDLTGAHWGLDTKGNITSALLRVYAIDDAGTLKWGVGYQGGFTYIRNTQDSATATNINLPEEILVNSDVSTDNSPMLDVGYIVANFTDAGDEWAITRYYPERSADGIWQTWAPTQGGFSAAPSINMARFTMIGSVVHFHYAPVDAGGTSNATSYTITGPIKGNQSNGGRAIIVNTRDNSAAVTTTGYVDLPASGSTTMTLFRASGGTGWTAANTKAANIHASYEAYQP